MSVQGKELRNTEKVGEYTSIVLPGFPNRGGETSESVSVHYVIQGEGEPVLLIHAPGQSLYTWQSVIPLLAKEYCVIALDLVGAGYSGKPDAMSYSMDEVADSILKFCDAIELKVTHVLGFSLGAVYALYAAQKAPERFAKIIAISPGGISETMPRFMQTLEKSGIGFIARELFGRKTLRRALSTCFYDATVCTERTVKEYYKTLEDFRSRQAFQYSLRNFDLDASLPGLFTLQKEVLVLNGADDRWHTPADIEKLKPYLTNGIYYTLRNAGHLMQEEKPEAVAEIVRKYLHYMGIEE
ncbi:MAG: alpha/beta hydrolase [Clostridiales bacterium]|nr:alpha/beta hydrolase [Clostridiales bacterium]